MKLLTVAVPCYNSQDYMAHAIESLLLGGVDVEIIIVDDGSADDTARIADDFAARHPGIVRAVHQENGGHGDAVMTGIRAATGAYFKVVDSDDWLDGASLHKLMDKLRGFSRMEHPIDLVICNYVYEHAADNTQHPMRFHNALPVDRQFTWSEMGRFNVTQFISMHTSVYRTEVLRSCGLVLPKHTFYVDNL